jgi:lipopolysaccharide transport system ATP-binding protein
MSKVVLKAEDISKMYRLGLVSTKTLSHDLNRWWSRARGKEDPYLKIGESNDRSKKGDSEYVWALKDINFEINQGDSVGIVGRNGAGKSTLLKILSRVTQPTTGSVKVKGRITSLLEVGTGFHPELTGRENIYLNGAILGMRKNEITRKLDEIIDFSGVERYIDTPVKRYSSGMYVRLAFSVAAHLECEILIIDEVLAVGDAEFQKKCLGKMNDASHKEGRTVLFVSHNMAAIQNLCNTGILIERGSIDTIGSIQKVISRYTQLISVPSNGTNIELDCKYLNSLSIFSSPETRVLNKVNEITSGENIIIEVGLKNLDQLQNPYVGLIFRSQQDNSIITSFNDRMILKNENFNKSKSNEQIRRFTIPSNRFNSGGILLKVAVSESDLSRIDESPEIMLEIYPGDLYGFGRSLDSSSYGHIAMQAGCEIINF